MGARTGLGPTGHGVIRTGFAMVSAEVVANLAINIAPFIAALNVSIG